MSIQEYNLSFLTIEIDEIFRSGWSCSDGARYNAASEASAGNVYKLISDQLGSVKLVVNVSDNFVAQQIDYEICASITPDNIASKKVAQKLGMKKSGVETLLGVEAEIFRVTRPGFAFSKPVYF